MLPSYTRSGPHVEHHHRVTRSSWRLQSIDTDHSGTITVEELKVGLRKQGSTVTEAELADLVRNLDADNSGTIDYEVRRTSAYSTGQVSAVVNGSDPYR